MTASSFGLGARRPSVSRAGSVLLLGAPAVAVLAGMAAEWLDFRALRVPLLLIVGVGVLATSYALAGARPGWRPFLTALAVGILTWAAAQCVYSFIHVVQGERFEADRFGPQWSQVVALIAAHAVFLGAPTGIAAGLLLQIPGSRPRGAAPLEAQDVAQGSR